MKLKNKLIGLAGLVAASLGVASCDETQRLVREADCEIGDVIAVVRLHMYHNAFFPNYRSVEFYKDGNLLGEIKGVHNFRLTCNDGTILGLDSSLLYKKSIPKAEGE